MTEINLNAIRENYNADPDRDDWPIQPVDAIGSDGQPTIAWWPVKSLGPIPDGHVLVFNDTGGWFFRPIKTN
jgi:hypothetical protein